MLPGGENKLIMPLKLLHLIILDDIVNVVGNRVIENFIE